MRLSAYLSLAVAAALGGATPPLAQVHVIETDVNIVTALDESDSIGRHEQWIERDGLARAVVDHAFLDAIARGRRARVGFAVFTWSSHGRTRMLVPWTLIASVEDAARVSRQVLSNDFIDESRFAGGDEDQSDPATSDDRLTDISAAIDLASSHLASAPFATIRSVMNVVGNGTDNVGIGPVQARNRALDMGFTINGLVVGHGLTDVSEHYRTEVVGGPGAFLMEVPDPEHVARAFVAKLRLDVAGLNECCPIGPAGLFDGLRLRRPHRVQGPPGEVRSTAKSLPYLLR